MSFFFVDAAVRTHFIKNRLVSLDLLFDWLVKDRTVQTLNVSVDLGVGLCRCCCIRLILLHRAFLAGSCIHAVISRGHAMVEVAGSVHVAHVGDGRVGNVGILEVV